MGAGRSRISNLNSHVVGTSVAQQALASLTGQPNVVANPNSLQNPFGLNLAQQSNLAAAQQQQQQQQQQTNLVAAAQQQANLVQAQAQAQAQAIGQAQAQAQFNAQNGNLANNLQLQQNIQNLQNLQLQHLQNINQNHPNLLQQLQLASGGKFPVPQPIAVPGI
jgi:hypothetical protein